MFNGRGTLRVPDIGHEVPPMAGHPYNLTIDFLTYYENKTLPSPLAGEGRVRGNTISSRYHPDPDPPPSTGRGK